MTEQSIMNEVSITELASAMLNRLGTTTSNHGLVFLFNADYQAWWGFSLPQKTKLSQKVIRIPIEQIMFNSKNRIIGFCFKKHVVFGDDPPLQWEQLARELIQHCYQ